MEGEAFVHYRVVDKWTRDYISRPKPDGYRSIHLVIQYDTPVPEHMDCNGLRVEVQIRTRLQYAWATAVETASTVSGLALKSGANGGYWGRFFELMDDYIATKEGTPLLYDQSRNHSELRSEVSGLVVKLKAITLLEGMQNVMRSFRLLGSRNRGYYLMTLRSKEQSIGVEEFQESDFKLAAAKYASEEEKFRENQDVHVVLVKVQSLQELESAYSSYFLDSSVFLAQVKQLLAMKS